MFVQVESKTEIRSFDDVEKIIFHTENGDLEFSTYQAVTYDKEYKSFTLVRQSSEVAFSNAFRIVTAVQ